MDIAYIFACYLLAFGKVCNTFVCTLFPSSEEKLSVDELRRFLEDIDSLPCVLPEMTSLRVRCTSERSTNMCF